MDPSSECVVLIPNFSVVVEVDKGLIRSVLRSKGLWLYDLAHTMGIHRTSLSAILNGKAGISNDFLIAVWTLTRLQPGSYLRVVA